MDHHHIRVAKDDGFGAELAAYLETGDQVEIVERDDGYLSWNPSVPHYFSPYEQWPAYERDAVKYAHGRVVDVGCGAGRVALYLQQQGREVIALDSSPAAVEICKLRGVKDVRRLRFTAIGTSLAPVGSWLLFGNNFGLFESRDRAVRLLKKMRKLSTGPDALILAESTDPYERRGPEHEAYRERNRVRGRMPGQLRLRVRHGICATPWFDYLLVSRQELLEIAEEGGWQLVEFIDGPYASYIAVLRMS